MESISNNMADLSYSKSTQRALKHLKGTVSALQAHLETQGDRELKHLRHLGTQRALGLSYTQCTWYFGTRSL